MNKKTGKVTNTCCANVKIAGLSFYRSKVCGAKASVERDGEHYCKRHDPQARLQKREADYAEYKRKQDAKHMQTERMQVCTQACTGIVNPVAAVSAARNVIEDCVTWWETEPRSKPPFPYARLCAALALLGKRAA